MMKEDLGQSDSAQFGFILDRHSGIVGLIVDVQ